MFLTCVRQTFSVGVVLLVRLIVFRSFAMWRTNEKRKVEVSVVTDKREVQERKEMGDSFQHSNEMSDSS
jgi:hypothetical protein